MTIHKRNILKEFAMIFTVIATLIVCSCTKDKAKEQIHDNQPKEICFKATTTTRGANIESSNLYEIYVTAFASRLDIENAESLNDIYYTLYFTNVPYREISGYFHSDPAYYWPQDTRLMTFAAYAPSPKELGAEIEWFVADDEHEDAGLFMEGFSPKADIKEQVDFVYGASITRYDYTNGGLELKMDHKLSRILLMGHENNPDYHFNIMGFRIAEVYGTADLGSGVNWINLRNKTTYSYTYDTPLELHSTRALLARPDIGNAFLIPQNLTAWNPTEDPSNKAKGAYIAILVQITDTAGNQFFPETPGEYEWVAIPFSTEWDDGYSYTYILDFTSGAGYTTPDSANPGQLVLNNNVYISRSVKNWTEDNIK